VLRAEGFRRLAGRRIGLVVHPASVAADLAHAAELFRTAPELQLVRLFGPQHGILGQTQDNMVEWRSFREAETGIECVSLYGEHRKPTPEMLAGLDVLVVDLQDVGARYYTFVWTTLLCMRAAAEAGLEVMVLDRPNPIGGALREGPVLDLRFSSFVGMEAVPIRHALTAGELARLCNARAGCRLEVVAMEGWSRSMHFGETGLPWVMPSPNMPTVEAALVYPGMCLLEGTELSEGRGTTRPFEIFGAPFIEPRRLVRRLAELRLPGVVFRPLSFEPTFQKHAGKLCGGAQLHVTDREAFRPVLTAVAVLATVRELWPRGFAWKGPPYEYETERPPIDILAGSDRLRLDLEAGRDVREIAAGWEADVAEFSCRAAAAQMYG
jgi:uncharacterized protein YbbC (DUF1343 family)